MGQKSRTIEERFWEKVEINGPDECWLWKGAKNFDGYGSIFYNGKLHRVHRVAFILANGEIPEGMDVCHNCPGGDNRACVNAKHLYPATHQENIKDLILKGPSPKPKGRDPVRAGLNDQDIIDIKSLFIIGNDIAGLATKYKVTLATIKRVVNRK
jgi:hypothetical protein